MMFDDGGGGGNTVSSRPANFDSSTIREGASAPNSSSSATDFIQDAFNDFIDSASDAFETAKEFVVDTYGDAKDWVDEKIVDPISDFSDDVSKFVDHFKNYDGSYSLHDNMRHEHPDILIEERGFIFHEQIFAFDAPPEFLKFSEEKISIVSADFKFMTGGWEAKYTDLSLLDIGVASISADINAEYKPNLNVECALWTPSFSINAFDKKIRLTAYVGGYSKGVEFSGDSFGVGLGNIKISVEE